MNSPFSGDPRNGGPVENSRKLVAGIMALIYIAVGIYVLVSKDLGALIPSMKLPLGLVLIAYGLFRGARFLKR